MQKERVATLLRIIAIPVLYALILRMFFGAKTWNEVFNMMSTTFLFLLPSIVGALTILLSKRERVKSHAYRIFMPWVPILIFFIITFALAVEGWPCLLMILPVFLIAASVGGMIAGHFKMRKGNNKVQISLITLLPFIIAPIEHAIGTEPQAYKAYTFTDIHAPAEKIWSNVTRVRSIREDQDKGDLTRLLHFPRPVKAELNYEGEGAYREAIFTNGLVFHETVTDYIDQKKMSFTIKAHPHEIPLTTMDEHLVVGGKYFDVLNGTYELEPLGNGSYRLHLYSYFKLNTSFNFYAAWWANAIMKDIQNNILQVEKYRSENE